MLTALELAGFKSFADKTRINFHDGVTAIVGPNGSGKSNVVDAIKWVMGTQSAKALRGSEMTDVIFNGAAGRKSLNTAEVTLEFDNQAGLFAIKSPKVRFTRRVYRSGEGEYLINGTVCRLKDIRELFAGTGAGAEAYSIIEQGRVDAMLQASPKDRRALFEEAAGISRFRLKKQEATRRLARVEQNLLRLSDIVDEVEGRLRRIRQQAGKARKYREQTKRLKELRTQLGLTDWRRLSGKLKEVAHALTEVTGDQGGHREELARIDQASVELETSANQLSEQQRSIQHRLSGVREQLAAAVASQSSERARYQELTVQREELQHRLFLAGLQPPAGGSSDAQREIQTQLRASKQTLEQTHSELVLLKDAAQTKQVEADRLGKSADELALELADCKRGLTSLVNERDAASSKTQQTKSEHALLCQELTKLEERCQETNNDYSKTLQVEAAAKLEAETLNESLANAQALTTNRQAELARKQTALAQAEAELTGLERHADSIQGFLRQLADVREEVQGFADTQADQGATAVYGAVADLLHVDIDTAAIIEAALGDKAQHMVVNSGEAIIEAVETEQFRPTHRANFQRLDCQTTASVVDRIDLSGEPGVMGRADTFVETAPEFSSLVRRLLGRTWVVDSLTTAAQLSLSVGRGLNFVTYNGELLTADGTVVLGPRESGGGLITQRKQLAEIQQQVQQAQTQLPVLRQEVTMLESETAVSTREISENTAKHSEAVRAAAELGKKSAALRERAAHLNVERERISDRIAECVADKKSVEAQIDSLDLEITKLGKQQQVLSETHTECLSKAETVLSESEAANAEILEKQLQRDRLEQQVELLRQQQEHLRASAPVASSIDTELRQLSELRDKLARSEAALLTVTSRIANLAWRRELLASEQSEVEMQLAEARRVAKTTQSQQRLLRKQLDQQQLQRQQLELQASQLRLERQTLADRMQDDYQIDLQTEADRLTPEQEIAAETRRQMEQEVATLRGQVNTIGSINLESLEELDELETRFEELSGQYRDLSEAKASLERLTSRINADSRQLFVTTLETIRGHFRELFRKLFGGGEADLVLLGDDQDVLECGVDVAASPPGKELRSISLLSGGEKTMTCVALLLAVFRSKPSPFCVLDEVDAALDEANIGRFTGVLNEFLSSTQFIVITHSKKTMTGANTMYGVTMQQSGVSKQVAVRFEDVTDDGHIRPAAMLRDRSDTTPAKRAA